MARQVKPFESHSPRWQREQRAKGIDPHRWNRWRKLSAKTRRATTPTDYGAGESVRDLLRAPLLDAAAARVMAAHTNIRGARRTSGDSIKLAAVRRNLDRGTGMTNRALRRLAMLSPQALAREIDDSLSRSYAAGLRSPFWYEKRG